MKKIVKKVRSRPKSQVVGTSRKRVVKQVPADDAKRDFIGRLKGIIRIVGDIESPIEPPEAWECYGGGDLERINQAAEWLNAESVDALDYQAIGRPGFPADAKKRGRGRPRHTQN
ncbi:MAG: hypothetical protein ABR920_16070 [Terriglobales bacterium]